MSLYDQVVDLSKPYLGPAAAQFIGRQCKSHLKIDPEKIQRGNLGELAKWVANSAALLMDEKKANDLSNRIKSL